MQRAVEDDERISLVESDSIASAAGSDSRHRARVADATEANVDSGIADVKYSAQFLVSILKPVQHSNPISTFFVS
jgi:hypothetical protein